MKGYGQFCPIAKASEILTERWTPLILRELICGSTRFNDLRRGVPLMSTALLARRLKSLEEQGVIERRPLPSGRGADYLLTEAGRELEPIVMAMGEWGARWARSRLTEDDLDPALLLWDIHRQARPENFPPGRTVIAFEFTDVPAVRRQWWLVSEREEGSVDLCATDPGFEVDLYVFVGIRAMTAVWMGDRSLEAAVAAEDIGMMGPPKLCRAFGAWLGLSPFAAVPDRRGA